MVSSFDRAFARRMQKHRKANGLSQQALGDLLDVDQALISKIETSKKAAGPDLRRRIAIALDVDIEELTLGQKPQRRRQIRDNPKPIRLGSLLLEDVFLLLGHHRTPLDFSVRYTHDFLRLPGDIKPHFDRLRKRAERRAKDAGSLYYNSPCARIMSVSQENARQLPTGEEAEGYVFELGPVSWDEYTVLNTILDEKLFAKGERTVRERYVKTTDLFTNAPDLAWCRLSNIFTLCMTPITEDGYALIQHRNPKGVNVAADKLICGVSENMHRFLDEAPEGRLAERLHPLQSSAQWAFRDSSSPRDHLYRPKGVPSPLLTALRGVYEELSPALYAILEGAPNRLKFLNVVMGMDYFNPLLIGVIELPFTRDQVKRLIEQSPPKGHGEWLQIIYSPLDEKMAETSAILSDQRKWVLGGLASFISAIQYWQANGGRAAEK